MRVGLREDHPVDIVHRVSAAVFGAVLAVFAAGGFASAPAFFSTSGPNVLGMVTNGALSVLSVVAAVVLLAASVWGGRRASTVLTGVGVVFLLSGLVHLALMNTSANVLAFRLSNVFFSLVAGMLLAFLGLYGRVSGGLPPDNPYRQERPRRPGRPHPEAQLVAERDAPEQGRERELLEAEIAMGEGKASREQQRMVQEDQTRRRAAEQDRAYRNVRAKRRRHADHSVDR